jgi:hypothetical protein
VYIEKKIKFRVIEKNIISTHNNMIKRLRLFQIIPTKLKLNKIKDKFKQVINGIISLLLIKEIKNGINEYELHLLNK